MANPPRAQKFRQDRAIVDPKNGFATTEFLRLINQSFDLLNYLAELQDQTEQAQGTADSAQTAANNAQLSADAAQETADAAALKTTTITAGDGLVGGGDLSANRTINAVGGFGVTVNPDNIEIDSLVVVTLTGPQTLTDKTLTTPILSSYTVAGVPSASPAGQLAYITNETGGAVVAFSDGVNWRRVTDRAIIS